MKDLVNKANELIEDRFLERGDDFPGNAYRIAAYGKLWTFDTHTHFLFDLSRMLGCTLIFFLQILGPPILFLSAAAGWGIRPSFYKDEVAVPGFMDFSAWENRKSTKILAMLFIACFCLNGVFVIMDEMKSWKKMDQTFRTLNRKTEAHLRGEGWLFLDAITNCWTILWCCLCTSVVIAPAQTPKDVVFDSLGLLFLYNLDDIGGDFGFLNADDWPGDRLAWIYNEMVKADKAEREREENGIDIGEGQSLVANDAHADQQKETCCERCGATFILALYKLTAFILTMFFFVLPAFTAMTSFESGGDREERLGGGS